MLTIHVDDRPEPSRCGAPVRARLRARGARSYWVAMMLVAAGCTSPPGDRVSGTPSVSSAMTRGKPAGRTDPVVYRERGLGEAAVTGTTGGDGENLVATVNGRSIARRRLIDLLIRSRGADVLEQLIAYECAAAEAAAKGITITASDVAFERRLAAERLWNPLGPFTTADLDRDEADRLLDMVIAQKRISPAEFDLVLRRNAYLRRIIEHDEAFTELDYRAEYERAYGERVRVRHIQLATPAEVARIQERLDAGESFEALARTHSANRASAQQGGLLEPFARNEERIPEIFRQTAFALKPGAVSGAVRAGEWYQLIRVEERIPAEAPPMGEVRTELARRLRERLSDRAMFALYERLVGEATIEVYDPVLRDAYREKTESRGG